MPDSSTTYPSIYSATLSQEKGGDSTSASSENLGAHSLRFTAVSYQVKNYQALLNMGKNNHPVGTP